MVTLDEVVFYDDENTISAPSITKQISVTENVAPASNNNVPSNVAPASSSSNNAEVMPIVETSTYLIDISVDGYYLDFDKNIFDYDLTIEDEEKLKIDPMLEDNSSSFIVNGNDKLKDGSLITIVVTNQSSNDQKTYNIKIHKEQKEQTQNYNLIFIIVIGVLLIVNVLRIIKRTKRKVYGE